MDENRLAIELDDIPRHRGEYAAKVIRAPNDQESEFLLEILVVCRFLQGRSGKSSINSENLLRDMMPSEQTHN